MYKTRCNRLLPPVDPAKTNFHHPSRSRHAQKSSGQDSSQPLRMAEVTVEQLHKIMDKPENIRNWIIIGAEEHGRSTLSQVLDDRAGVRLTDPSVAPPKRPAALAPPPDGDEEQEGECRSGGISLYHREILPEPEPPEEPEEDPHGRRRGSQEQKKSEPEKPLEPEVPPEEYLLNLIGSQGYAEFSTDVSSALRISDGALVVIDCIQVCCSRETERGRAHTRTALAHTSPAR